MADASTNDSTVLKVLSGVQIGAETALAPGEYSLGAGPEDDLQFVDVSLRPGHAKLRVAPGKIEIRAGAGAVTTSHGQTLAPDSDVWSEVEPLEIVTVGTVRFALGPTTAQWTTLADAPPEGERSRGAPAARARSEPPARYFGVLSSLAFFVLGGLLVFLGSHGAGRSAALGAADPQAQFAEVRAALDEFPFGKPIALRLEVDGEIFATGYVDTPVQRRALVAAVEKTAVPVKLRLQVLEALRAQIDDLVRAEKAKLSYTLSPEGVLTLSGLILRDADERKFVERVRNTVIGLADVQSEIVTASKLLVEIEKLAKGSKLDPYVLLRLDAEVVEASGALPTDKIDLWIGFLQSYSMRFAAQIGLRSLVRLQNPDGTAPEEPPRERAVVVGNLPNALDVERLAEGRFNLNDVFASKGPAKDTPPAAGGQGPRAAGAAAQGSASGAKTEARAAASTPDPTRTALGAAVTLGASVTPDGAAHAAGAAFFAPAASASAAWPPTIKAAEVCSAEAGVQACAAGAASQADPAAQRARAAADLVARANDFLKTLAGASAAAPSSAAAVGADKPDPAANSVSRRETSTAALERWLPLLNERDAGEGACRPGSHLTVGNIAGALFWLDLLSVGRSGPLQTMDVEQQGLILEAALNPTLAGECLRRAERAVRAERVESLYLRETQRNPAFIHFIADGLPAYPLEVTGADVTARFIQVRDGRRFNEGVAPDGATRLAIVGELGAAVRGPDGYATVIYADGVNWLAR